MPEGTITCPQCGHAFEMSDALTHQIRDHVRMELQEDILRREAEVKRKGEEARMREEQVAKAREALGEEVERQLKTKLAEAESRAAKKSGGAIFRAAARDARDAEGEG